MSEADPLVIKEALAAGVSVVVSENASASLDERDCITVNSEDDMNEGTVVRAMQEAIGKNDEHRTKVREYARTKFDYKVTAHAAPPGGSAREPGSLACPRFSESRCERR